MKTVDFLDAVRVRYKLRSDYQLAKKLGWHPARVSGYRTKARELDDDACIQIAQALEMPPEYVMACIAATRAKSTESKRAWMKAAKLLKTGSAAAILSAVLFASGEPSARAEDAQRTNCILRQIKEGARRRALFESRRCRRRRRAAQKPLRLHPPLVA